MRSILLITTLFFAFFTFGQSFTKVTNPENVKLFLKEKQKGIKSIQANFTETTTQPMLKEAQNGSGQFWFAKPDKIRWDNTSANVLMLMDGKQTKLYEKGKLNTNAAAQKIGTTIQQMIVGMISGDFLDNGEYTIIYHQNASNYKLELQPKNARMAKEIKQMNLIFNRSTGYLTSLEMVQKTGASVQYTFNEMKVNTSIPPTKFIQQ